ncbi:hypothetical protein HS141_14280 [Cetobacterium somerae]|uniref:hypothetical protein n=1 Tax=Cetobacterium somerae TaxID=188913 RepID=UPI00211E802D|nr:hypothetical protein [Cetobacterium somerae]MCQ9628084.1 hypothetical protein [Cetobacterium somerae]
MKHYEFFNWLFQLRSDQVLFVILIILGIFVANKTLKVLDEKSKKIDKKDEKILELIDKVNSTQLEITKTLESLKSKNDLDQAVLIGEFKLLRTKLTNLENKIIEFINISK